MPLFSGLRINRQIKGGKLDLAAAVQELERAKEDVAVNIMTRYLEVLYCKELVGVAERQLALSNAQAERRANSSAPASSPNRPATRAKPSQPTTHWL